MTPVVLATELFEMLLEQGSHGDDSVRHPLDLIEPLCVQRAVVQNLRRDPSTVDRRIGVKRSNEDLDLRVDSLLLFCRLTYDREGSHSLTIKTLNRVSASGPLGKAWLH